MINKGSVQELHEHINNIEKPQIQFTVEEPGPDGGVPFLDTYIALESSQPLGAPGEPFLRIFLISNVNYMPTNSLRGIFHTYISGQSLK